MCLTKIRQKYRSKNWIYLNITIAVLATYTYSSHSKLQDTQPDIITLGMEPARPQVQRTLVDYDKDNVFNPVVVEKQLFIECYLAILCKSNHILVRQYQCIRDTNMYEIIKR
jgi:hypothetical protein